MKPVANSAVFARRNRFSDNEHANLGRLETRQETWDCLGDSLANMLDIWVYDHRNMAPDRQM